MKRCVTRRATASHKYLQKEVYLAYSCSTGLTEPRATELTKVVYKSICFKCFFSPFYRKLHCFQIIQSMQNKPEISLKITHPETGVQRAIAYREFKSHFTGFS